MAPAPHVLTIAGSDPSGGAGIQADLKTFQAFGAYGMAVITALTAQNTRGVTGIHDVPPDFVRAQLRTLLEDCRVDAAKTGMLKSPEIIEAVADGVGSALAGRIVVDPVMVATSGDRLIDDDAVETMRRRLFPLAAVVTPNRQETEALTGRPLSSPADAGDAGRAILDDGPRAVLVKGVRDGDEFLDLLVTGDGVHEYRRPVLDVPETHGTGCTFSAAIAAGLAFGLALEPAIERAKEFVWRAIRGAVPVGRGSLPLNHRVPVPGADE